MRNVFVIVVMLFMVSIATAQQTPTRDTTRRANRSRFVETVDSTAPKTNYSYTETFAPFFYTKNGNEYRAATGEPGPKYWQNRADYQLAAKLNDETNEITGTEVLTYTNNSPLKMDFIWMQLDQNLFKQDSRGSAIMPIGGSRNGAVDRYLMQVIRSNQ